MELYSDTYYISRVKNGDTDCFACLIDKYSKQIFTLVYRIVGNHEDAEELAQDAFMAAFRNINKFEAKSAFSTWLYSIAYNLAISATRKHRPPTMPIEECRVAEDSIDDIPIEESDNMFELLEQAMTKLSADESAIITLFYQEDKSLDEITKIMNVSMSNAKVKLHRSRKHLMTIISKLQKENYG